MTEDTYFHWLVNETPTEWWHDSGDLGELEAAMAYAASGVTMNPILAHQALQAAPEYWRERIGALPPDLDPVEKAQKLTHAVVTAAAEKLAPQHRASNGATGYVCAQVNPQDAGDRESMLAMARKFHAWAPNIAVKLPVTAAGLDVLETCVAEGITITATVSFTVPQVVAAAKRHRKGAARAREAGITPGHCFAVIMIGRLDDYLRDVAWDNHAEVSESDIRQAGLAATKRAYRIFQDEGFEAVLLIAALRGTYHMIELAGADFIMSIHPRYQAMLLDPGVPREQRIDQPVDPQVIERLQTLPEFIRSYEPDGMAPWEFITYGASQKTLSQFDHVGWSMLESFDLF
ncbi:MAG: transaldolase family protein [Anaerolineae bacterium]